MTYITKLLACSAAVTLFTSAAAFAGNGGPHEDLACGEEVTFCYNGTEYEASLKCEGDWSFGDLEIDYDNFDMWASHDSGAQCDYDDSEYDDADKVEFKCEEAGEKVEAEIKEIGSCG